MLPTIDIPEPMQELGPAFVAGCRLGGGSSTTECCCCNALSTASAACAAVSLSFSGALLLNMSISVFRRHSLRKGQSCRLAIERELTQSLLLPRREDPQVRTPFANRTAQSRMPPRWSLRLRAIPRPEPCQEFHVLTVCASAPVPVFTPIVKKN